jgi:hypothetical protein
MQESGDPTVWYASFGFWSVVICLVISVAYLTRARAWWRGSWSASKVRWRSRGWLPMVLAFTSVFAGAIYLEIANFAGLPIGLLLPGLFLLLLGGVLFCSLPLVAWLSAFDFAVPPHLRSGAAAVPAPVPAGANRAQRRASAKTSARPGRKPRGSWSGPVTIRFYRPAVKFRDRFRAYRLEIDGEPVGEVRYGKEILVETRPGARTVRARIDWTGSEELTLDLVEGEAFSIRVEPSDGSTVESLQTTDGYLQLTVEDRD